MYGTEARPMTANPNIPTMCKCYNSFQICLIIRSIRGFINQMLNFASKNPSVSMNCTGVVSKGIASNIQTCFNDINSMNSTKLNPKISNDLSIIIDKFPYNHEVYHLLEIMVS